MADDFFGCPYTGGDRPCNPNCVQFIREHNKGFATFSVDIPAPRVPSYCRQFGRVDRIEYQNIRKGEDDHGS